MGKPDGSLRKFCIDPQPLNIALHLMMLFHSYELFSRLDAQSAFWHIHVRLDEVSSLLTTMATPFGHYRWKRLPFGLKVSSEIFQKRLLQALKGLNGIFV